MKKTLLLVAALFYFVGLNAQGVIFEKGTWKEVLEKANRENKIIFVDIYTSWCGPCKNVAKTVFPNAEFGAYYNEHFINFQVDAEKGEGPAFVKTYPATGYPTFYYINGKGEVLRTFTGAKNVHEFVQEGKMVNLTAKYGGMEAMKKTIEAGKADREAISLYYAAAPVGEKPFAINAMLKAMTDEELVDLKNPYMWKLSLYDKALCERFIDAIIKCGRTDGEFSHAIVFPFQAFLSDRFDESIMKGDRSRFDELMKLKKRFNAYKGHLLDGDAYLIRDRGIFWATPEYLELCFLVRSKSDDARIKELAVSYMENLMKTYPIDSLHANPRYVYLKNMVFENVEYLVGKLPCNQFMEMYYMCAGTILGITDYFWRVSPSDKKTVKLCQSWVDYANAMQPYHQKIPFGAASMSYRLGNFKRAEQILLESQKLQQEELKVKQPGLLKNYTDMLRDIRNRKL